MSNDNDITFMLEKEQQLKDEIAQHNFVSSFAIDFIDASLKRADQNIKGVKEAQEHANKTVVVANMMYPNKHKEITHQAQQGKAETNQNLELLDNCKLVLERMKEICNELEGIK